MNIDNIWVYFFPLNVKNNVYWFQISLALSVSLASRQHLTQFYKVTRYVIWIFNIVLNLKTCVCLIYFYDLFEAFHVHANKYGDRGWPVDTLILIGSGYCIFQRLFWSRCEIEDGGQCLHIIASTLVCSV